MLHNSEFPPELLTAPASEKLAYFVNRTVVHRHLKQAFDQFLDAIKNPGGASLIFLFGPTGVGKTTLIRQVVRVILESSQADMMLDSAHIPIAMVEARSPSNGSFDWKDYYKSVLDAIGEPFADYKVRSGSYRTYGSASQRHTVKVKPNLSDLQADVEYIMKQRKLTVFLVDEAQRLTKIVSGKRQQDQMDAIQSMASFTATRYGLIGTYELLQLRNLSGQLSRRSIDIHFPRYQIDSNEDIADFKRVLKSFALSLPLQETPDLEQYWEFFYERSIGCVGIVKDWLTQAYQKALSESSPTLKKEYLNYYAQNASKCMQMLNEALEGENILSEDECNVEQLRQKLGIVSRKKQKKSSQSRSINQNSTTQNIQKSPKNKHHPGERNPKRDIIGGSSGIGDI